MASKPALMSALFTQLISFATELAEMYPNDTDFPLFLTTVQLMKSTNPALMVKHVNDNIGQFEEKILEKDDSFFLDYSFSEFEGYVDANIFTKLKQYVAGMSPESKAMTWQYLINIMRLSKACR
jgi:hypothetical protein